MRNITSDPPAPPRKIVKVPDKILTSPTKPVEKFDDLLRQTVQEMEETLKRQDDPEGVGLSANQVGLDLRLAIVRLNPEDQDAVPHLLAIVNPQIISRSSALAKEYEGCLSVPNKYGPGWGSEAEPVHFQSLKGEPLTIKAAGFLARI